MQKIKNILSNKDDDVPQNTSPRSSGIGSTTHGYDTTENIGDGTRSTGLTGNTGGIHSGTTGVGSNIGTNSSSVNSSGLGNTATAAGDNYVSGRGGLSGRDDALGDRTLASGNRTGSLGTTAESGLAREGLNADRNLGSTGTTTGTTGSGSGLLSKITGNHSVGHDSRDTSRFDPTGQNTHHDHKHLQHVTHATHRHSEVEEVERQRDVDRHVHHLQHHVQPVQVSEATPETQANISHPVTNIKERHVNTDEDVKLFNSLGEKHRDAEQHMPKERTVVDLGEKVNTTTHHHVHHVTQPVVEQEVHNKHRIHTVIPTTHTVHEAPIIHKSSMHEPVGMDDFLKGGGKLSSGIGHRDSGLLATGDCDRQVDGLGEKLVSDLNLKPSTFGHSGTTSTTGATGAVNRAI